MEVGSVFQSALGKEFKFFSVVLQTGSEKSRFGTSEVAELSYLNLT